MCLQDKVYNQLPAGSSAGFRSTGGNTKNTKGATFSKYNGGPNMKWGTYILNGGWASLTPHAGDEPDYQVK